MPKQRISKQTKLFVAARANHCCEYCQCLKSYVPGPFHNDHIEPESLGGSSEPFNLAFACDGCNGHKHQKTGAVDPVSKQMTRLFHPRNDKWKDHFRWSDNLLLIEGVTAVGRATLDALFLNRSELVNLRSALKEIGKHPPKHTI